MDQLKRKCICEIYAFVAFSLLLIKHFGGPWNEIARSWFSREVIPAFVASNKDGPDDSEKRVQFPPWQDRLTYAKVYPVEYQEDL